MYIKKKEAKIEEIKYVSIKNSLNFNVSILQIVEIHKILSNMSNLFKAFFKRSILTSVKE